jgi:brefeldin A-resistance guanine nucleotide exchange factor 1
MELLVRIAPAPQLSPIMGVLTFLTGLNSPNIAVAMGNLASAATHCKFEASDSVSDEVVLLKMLQVLQMALICPCGLVLSDEAVCEMMETGLSMCCQMRLSGK